MKIIAGERKGHSLSTPGGTETRPTLSRIRESLFNIIAGDIPGSIFCDLYAGAGSIGLEALSRGAERCYFVETARDPWQHLRQNIQKLEYGARSFVTHGDAMRWEIPAGSKAPDIIFADPPYQPDIIEKLIRRLELSGIPEGTLIILQTPAKYSPTTIFKHLRTARYGATALHFLISKSEQVGPESDSEASQWATDAK